MLGPEYFPDQADPVIDALAREVLSTLRECVFETWTEWKREIDSILAARQMKQGDLPNKIIQSGLRNKWLVRVGKKRRKYDQLPWGVSIPD